MKQTRFIAGISAFAMILGAGTNYISAEETTTFIYGDVDGDGVPQINDLTKISLYLLQDMTFDEAQKKAADVNADGNIDLADLATMKQYMMHDNIELGKLQNDSDNDITINHLTLSDCNAFNYQTSDYFDFLLPGEKGFEMSAVIKSVKDFEDYNIKFENSVDKVSSYFNMSDEFFKDNTLFIIPMSEGSGSIKDEITDICINTDNKVSIDVTSSVPAIGECDMAIWHLAVAVPNKYIKDADTSDFKINRIVNKEKYMFEE